MKIIAEFCQNHNGDVDVLKEMIKEAAKSGATHAKIQTMFASDLTIRPRFEKGQESILRPYEDEFQRLHKLELDWDAHTLFVKECKKHKLVPLSTPFLTKDILNLKVLGFKEVKIASYDCASYPMIQSAVNNFDELYISTGSTYISELKKTVSILYNKQSYTLMHCIVQYPTPAKHLNLNRISYLKRYSKSVGYSDHTINLDACIVALYVGVDAIEKHFTVLPKEDTKDGIISMNPEELKRLVEFTKYTPVEKEKYVKIFYGDDYNKMLGVYQPSMTLEESRNRDYYRGRFAEKIKDGYKFNWEK